MVPPCRRRLYPEPIAKLVNVPLVFASSRALAALCLRRGLNALGYTVITAVRPLLSDSVVYRPVRQHRVLPNSQLVGTPAADDRVPKGRVELDHREVRGPGVDLATAMRLPHACTRESSNPDEGRVIAVREKPDPRRHTRRPGSTPASRR